MGTGRPANLATCSFAWFRPHMGMPVRIAVGRPRRLTYDVRHHLGELAPGQASKQWDDPATFEAAYRRHLDDLGADTVTRIAHGIRLTSRVDQDVPLVLLCHEDLSLPGYRCHRTTFARWWAEQTGEHVPELGPPLHEVAARTGAGPAESPEPTLF